MEGLFKACYSVTFLACHMLLIPWQSSGAGRKAKPWAGEGACLTFVEPQDCTWHSPSRKQSLHLTDKEVEAQRGAGTCPRSLSNVKEYLGYLWQGKAYTWRKSRES